MKQNGKCNCGEESTGWVQIKCCNICGMPHEDEEMNWSSRLIDQQKRDIKGSTKQREELRQKLDILELDILEGKFLELMIKNKELLLEVAAFRNREKGN